VEHVGIDLGARRSHVVVIDEQGQVTRHEVKTSTLPMWLRGRPPSRVVMEASTQSPAIGAASRAAKHETFIVPGNVVRTLGVGARGIKTDFRDGEALARASQRNDDLPSVHLRSDESRSRREQMVARALLVKHRKGVALSVKSWLRGRLIVLEGRASSGAFPEAVRRAALDHPDGLPASIDLLLQTYEHLTTQIEKLDEEVLAIAEKDETCARLMTVPGVGPIVALAFSTHIDDVNRFASAEDLASYLALVPGEWTTGGRVNRRGTIQAGPGYLKALLVQGAWTAWRTRPNDPMVLWARHIACKQNKRVAIVALARKMASVLYAVWKHGTKYDPARASTVREAPPEGAAQKPRTSRRRTPSSTSDIAPSS
jgi:transposase